MQLILSRDIDRELWDEKIKASPIENVFSYSWYLDAVCENWAAFITPGYSTLFPFAIKENLNFKQAYQPIFTRFFETIGKEFSTNDVFSNLNSSFNFIQLRNSENRVDSIPRIYQELDLNEALKFSTNAKRLIKKAEPLFELQEGKDPEKLITIFRNTALQKIDTLNENDLERLNRLMKAALKMKSGKLIYLMAKNEIVGGAFFLCDKSRITLLKSACFEHAKKSGGMYFLIGKEINKSITEFKTFDFGGSNEKTVSDFYRKFGAKDMTYYECVLGKKPVWYKALKNIVGKL